VQGRVRPSWSFLASLGFAVAGAAVSVTPGIQNEQLAVVLWSVAAFLLLISGLGWFADESARRRLAGGLEIGVEPFTFDPAQPADVNIERAFASHNAVYNAWYDGNTSLWLLGKLCAQIAGRGWSES
jgi:hypothetical protein